MTMKQTAWFVVGVLMVEWNVASIDTSYSFDCDLGAVAIGADVECPIVVQEFDTSPGGEGSTVTVRNSLNLIDSTGAAPGCDNPRITIDYVHNDYGDAHEWFKVYEGFTTDDETTLIELCNGHPAAGDNSCDTFNCVEDEALYNEYTAGSTVPLTIYVSGGVDGLHWGGGDLCPPNNYQIDATITFKCTKAQIEPCDVVLFGANPSEAGPFGPGTWGWGTDTFNNDWAQSLTINVQNGYECTVEICQHKSGDGTGICHTKVVDGSAGETAESWSDLHALVSGLSYLKVVAEAAVVECAAPATFVWETLMESETDKPNVVPTLSIDEATLTLTVEVEADYLGKSAADDNGFLYGTTYVIDFEDFNAHSDNIKKPGSCQNRDGAAFESTALDWEDDVWAFSATPNAGDIGTAEYLAYAPGGDWTLEMSDVCTVKYSASFTWDELTSCTDSEGVVPYISTEDYANNITLSGTLYINVVSPFDYKTDYGYYRVYQLVSYPFQIVVSKTVYVLGAVGINLLTMDIIAVYKEDKENTFRLIVLTESAEYLRLSRDNLGTAYLQVFDAADANNEVESANFETLETAETGDACLGNKDYICTQLWQITASDVRCTTGGIYTDFSGTYSIQFNAECRDSGDPEIGTELNEYCTTWLEDHRDVIEDNGKVLLQADLSWKDEICDPEIFEVQFEAAMEFYADDSFVDGNEVSDEYLYQVGESWVFVKISTDYPSDHYEVFETELLNVWICTFDPLTPAESIAFEVDDDVGGCFADETDNVEFTTHIYHNAPVNEDEFTLYSSTALESNEIEFGFLVPDKVERDTLYIHAEIEVSLDNGDRRRMLLGGRKRSQRKRVKPAAVANQMEHFVDRIGIGSSPQPKPVPQAPVHHPKYPLEAPSVPVQQPWVISLQSPWVMAIGALLALVLTVNLVFLCYTNCVGPRRLAYSPVKGTDVDSELDGAFSERDALNFVSE